MMGSLTSSNWSPSLPSHIHTACTVGITLGESVSAAFYCYFSFHLSLCHVSDPCFVAPTQQHSCFLPQNSHESWASLMGLEPPLAGAV